MFFFFLLFLILCATSAICHDEDKTHVTAVERYSLRSCSWTQFRAKRRGMILAIHKNPSLGPGWLRASFHDCITTVKGNPKSGCNGSLRFELDHILNIRLRQSVNALETFVDGFCLNWADALLMSAEAAVFVMGNINVTLVDFKRPVQEATHADYFDGFSALPPNSSFEKQLVYYKARGLNVRDLLSSTIMGHSVGGFLPPPPLGNGRAASKSHAFAGGRSKPSVGNGRPSLPRKGSLPRPLQFTSTPQRMNHDYAVNLLQKITTKKNQKGFNTLRSDDAFTESIISKGFLKFYVRYPNYLKADFVKFLYKMRNLKGPSSVNAKNTS